MSRFRPAEFPEGLPDFIGASEGRIVARMTLGDQHLATALHDKLPSLVTLSNNAGRVASGRIAKPPHRYR